MARFLAGLKEGGGLKGTDIANIAGVSRATVSRWTNGCECPQPRMQLIISDLSYVVMRLNGHYTPGEIRAWLYACHPQLEGRRAIDAINEDKAEKVIAILDRLDADAYV